MSNFGNPKILLMIISFGIIKLTLIFDNNNEEYQFNFMCH
jgi:hypothetical protein